MSDPIEDGLTPEEREALTINDDDTGEPEATAAAAAEPPAAETKPNEEKPADPDPAGAEQPAAATTEQPASAAAPAAAEPEDAPGAPAQPAPVFVAQAVADADAKLAEITSRKDALGAKFDDGDITTKEYQAELDALNKQERAIERAQDRAQLAAEMDEQAKKNAWFSQAQQFARDNGYIGDRRLNLLDAEVRAVATREPSLNGAQVLAKAHQNLIDDGLSQPKAGTPPANKPAAPKPELPPSTHKLPAAGVDDAAGGQWAELDRLATTDPIRYEQQLASMKESDRERYLAA